MPRSRKRIDADNRAIERGEAVVKQALADFTGRPQATVIASRIQGNTKWAGQITKDTALLRYLWGEGLKILIRDALAKWELVASKDEAPPQLDLFPEDEREIVRQIGMARIWVPSRDAHVQYHDLPTIEVREAAAYYRALGLGNIRTANLLRQIAAIRDGVPLEDEAAA